MQFSFTTKKDLSSCLLTRSSLDCHPSSEIQLHVALFVISCHSVSGLSPPSVASSLWSDFNSTYPDPFARLSESLPCSTETKEAWGRACICHPCPCSSAFVAGTFCEAVCPSNLREECGWGRFVLLLTKSLSLLWKMGLVRRSVESIVLVLAFGILKC